MGDIKGFMKYERKLPQSEDPKTRLKHWSEFYQPLPIAKQKEQAARCMDCGIPFCHSGCPLGNLIPDFNHAVFEGKWKKAYEILNETNNFPEFTGRVCPAPCESSCVLGINSTPVTIEFIEKTIIEKAFKKGWVKPQTEINRSGKKVAIIGSGPAGLACGEQLNKAGHQVTIYERADRIGGLLRYGIPDFKLDKSTIDRRLQIMQASGIEFITNTNVGVDITVAELKEKYDAIVLCGGSTIPRDLNIPGREFTGIHAAMDYLTQNNKKQAGHTIDNQIEINVADQDIIVIGGGDTGSDCIGTSNRLGAKSVTQIEIMNKPPDGRDYNNPWPNWPMILRTSSSHEEGCDREWSILTKQFLSEDGVNLSGVQVVNVEWQKSDDGKYQMTEIESTKRNIPCNKAFLAIGFVHPQKVGLLDQLGVDFDERGNVKTDQYQTSVKGVFSAGDMRRGQSLVVWAISEGREAAIKVDEYLSDGQSVLRSKDESVLAM